MTPGIIEKLDHDNDTGYISPEHGGEHIPFDFGSLAKGEDIDKMSVGDRVLYRVEGGMAGIMATDVTRVSRAESER